MNHFADMLDMATKAGTLPMQVLLLVGLMILGLSLRYMHNENRRVIERYTKRMDEKDDSMSKERVDRINMLMKLIENDAKVKAELTAAVQNNTKAIEDLEKFIEMQADVLKGLISSIQKTK